MKIEPRNLWPVEKAQRAYQRSRVDKADETAGQGDRVELSPDVQAVQRLVEEVRQLPEVRDNVVEEIRQRLQEGNYRVSAADLAARMLKRTD